MMFNSLILRTESPVLPASDSVKTEMNRQAECSDILGSRKSLRRFSKKAAMKARRFFCIKEYSVEVSLKLQAARRVKERKPKTETKLSCSYYLSETGAQGKSIYVICFVFPAKVRKETTRGVVGNARDAKASVQSCTRLGGYAQRCAKLNTAKIKNKVKQMSVIENLKNDKTLVDTIYLVSQFSSVGDIYGREILRKTPHDNLVNGLVRDFYVSTSGAEWGRISIYPVEGDTVEVSRFGAIDDVPLEEADEWGDVRIPIQELPSLLKRLGLKPRSPEEVRKDRPKMSFCDRWGNERSVGREPLHKLLPHLKPKVGPRLEKRVYRFMRENFALENSPWEDGHYGEQPWCIRVFPTRAFRGKRAERVLRTLEGFQDALKTVYYDFEQPTKFHVSWAVVTAWIESAIYHTRAMQHWGPRVARNGIKF